MIQSLASGLMERAKFQQGFKVGFPIKISTIVISKHYETINHGILQSLFDPAESKNGKEYN